MDRERISLQELLRRRELGLPLCNLIVRGGGRPGVQLRGAHLENVTFHELDLTDANFQGAQLRYVTIEHGALAHANFSRATLEEVTVRNTEADDINLSQAILQKVTILPSPRTTFRNANLSGASAQELDLRKIKLEGATFDDANLAHTQLQEADLHSARFHRTNLTAANLRGADIRGADFTHAALRETILKEVIRDAATNLKQAKYRNRIIGDHRLLQDLANARLVQGAEEGTAGQERIVILRRTLPITLEQGKLKVREALYGRPKQQEFRSALLHAYEQRCAVTGCPIIELLEAAHIIPFALDPRNNHRWNGLLLRADIHTLFDLNLLEIEPSSGVLYLHPRLQQDPLYRALHQQAQVLPPLSEYGERIPREERQWREALHWRWTEYQQYLEGE